jgi:hypothetical protein
MFKNIQNNIKSPPYQERVTGIMIIYPTLMIQVIEVRFNILTMFTPLLSHGNLMKIFLFEKKLFIQP